MGDVDLNAVRDLIIHELTQSRMRPTELLALLGEHYPDSAIKEVVLRLLQEGRVEMAADRQLTLHEAAA
jgi:hypothetical protein